MTGTANRVPRILHVHASFEPNGTTLRCVRLINAFGGAAFNALVSGEPDRRGAAALLEPMVVWARFPRLKGKPWPWRLKNMAAAMAGYDLVCTYGWGAIDAVLAHTLFADVYKLPPLVHHEDGFEEDEAEKRKAGRNLYRRIALGRASALVVPSHTLERIALDEWEQPRTRVRRIANGVATRAYAKKPKPDVLPGVVKRKGELWLGALAGLRKVKNLTALVRAVSFLGDEWQLVIAGEGPERAAILAEAEAEGIEHRVHLPGFVADPASLVGLFDVYALSSTSEQLPTSVIEAMAAGLPVAAPAVGDVAQMVAEENLPFIVAPGDERELRRALVALAEDPAQRRKIGEANRARARKEYDEAAMIRSYKALYWELMGRK
ncbi:MAG: glycosyltransferase family 4 protein [Porphyrobacter sp.]|nr:glycosyltransferase family 4 protein [Porphyrobacter sp.]